MEKYISLALLPVFLGLLRFYLILAKARIRHTVICMVWHMGIRKSLYYSFLRVSIK